MRYAKYLSGKVGERIAELHQKQLVALSLLEEVAVLQELAGTALGNYERAIEKAEEFTDMEQRMRVQQLASSYLIEVVNQVRDMTVAAARVQDSGRQVDMMTIGSVMAQFMVFVEDKARAQLRDPDKFLQEIGEHIQNNLLTVDQVAKTRLTPQRLEQDMRSIIDSVPEVA